MNLNKLFALLVVLLLTSCMTKKKAVEYVKSTPEISSELCLELYPVKEYYVHGDTVVEMDTLYEEIFIPGRDTIINDTVFITEHIPRNVYITKTRVVTDTLYRADSAAITNLRHQNEALARGQVETLKENISLRKTKDRLIKILVVVTVIFGAGVLLRIKKLI